MNDYTIRQLREQTRTMTEAQIAKRDAEAYANSTYLDVADLTTRHGIKLTAQQAFELEFIKQNMHQCHALYSRWLRDQGFVEIHDGNLSLTKKGTIALEMHRALGRPMSPPFASGERYAFVCPLSPAAH